MRLVKLSVTLRQRPLRDNGLSYWKNQHFKALQAAWYKRLSDDGFEDAEEIIGDDLELSKNVYNTHWWINETDRIAREEYYDQLSHRVREFDFISIVDELILTWFADGKRIKDIVIDLRDMGKTRCRQTIMFTIRRYEMLWGMKKYTARQLNKNPKKKTG